ncbi:MAG: glycosyltransferase family 2 protein [Candidatus Omnitrophica bacterium]|nr:glycosyltransferase family 2 protein [Candidatus Omnitrophota bacterium]
MILAFWLLISLTLYCYFGYPLLLWLMAQLWSNPVQKGSYEPRISVVLSVWNEEDVIKEKLQNLLSLDYPKEKMEILIGSDGSTDKTTRVIRGFNDPRIHLIEGPRRQGKMAAINELVQAAKNEAIVFCDARQTFAPNAIRELVANLADRHVGCVSGELIFKEKKEEGATAKGVGLYWNYEKFIRTRESRLHSMLGATGAIYAIRRELFVPIPARIVLDDMFVPLQIIRKGYRAVMDESAKAYDQAADSPREEHRRKTRTLFGNYQIFGLFPDLFNPLCSPIAIQLFSHKLLRVLIPLFLILVFILDLLLIGEPLYQIMFYLQIVFYGMAVTGALSRYQKHGIFNLISKICYIPYVFCLLNFSALAGTLRFFGSKQEVMWEKARGIKEKT